MPSATIKALVNVPLTGTVKYVDFYPAKEKDGTTYSPQIGLKGTWDGFGDGTVYLPSPVMDSLLTQKMAQLDGEKAFQGQTVAKFKWLYPGKVKILKLEQGQKRFTTVTPADGAVTAAQVGTGPIVAPSAVAVGKQLFAPPSEIEARWAEIERTYKRCVEIATDNWPEFSDQALVAATATVFIEANKRSLSVPEDAGDKQRRVHPTESFAGMPTQLTETPDPELPEWMQGQ